MRTLCSLITLIALTASSAPVTENPRCTAPEGEPLAGVRICVDAGHGGQSWGRTRGYTGGTRSAVSDQTESDANLRVALFLWDLLTQAGAEVVMTRTEETRLSEDCLEPSNSQAYRENRSRELGIRCRVAEANDCDCIISIHHNAVGNASVNFSTAFFFDPVQYRSDEGTEPPVEHPAENVALARSLAEAIVASLDEHLQVGSRPARHGDYHVLRETSLPAVIVEAAFMTNPDQAEWMENLAYHRLAAIAIFEGILAAHGVTTETEEEAN
ncbi:N-acetylmuramoyl-L-alanine amidase [Candidatus Sumerlaeota bacterium]|nr:N-acetylmuramoyl-L-alanine amidase [Candidatus Sumerlaeota bacterium]